MIFKTFPLNNFYSVRSISHLYTIVSDLWMRSTVFQMFFKKLLPSDDPCVSPCNHIQSRREPCCITADTSVQWSGHTGKVCVWKSLRKTPGPVRAKNKSVYLLLMLGSACQRTKCRNELKIRELVWTACFACIRWCVLTECLSVQKQSFSWDVLKHSLCLIDSTNKQKQYCPLGKFSFEICFEMQMIPTTKLGTWNEFRSHLH